MGKTIAARKARIRAAINQWPTPVANAITPRQMHSIIKLVLLKELRRRITVTSKSNAIKNPAIFTTESERVTIEPAISFAFDKPKVRKTPKAAGATTAPKKSAAPNQQASKTSRVTFRTVRLPNQTHQSPPTVESLAERFAVATALSDQQPSTAMKAQYRVGPDNRRDPAT
jgi:hypothetical protein